MPLIRRLRPPVAVRLPLFRQRPPAPPPYIETWPDTCPEWVSMLCNWGDCIAALGNLQETLRRTKGKSAGVVYYGRWKELPAFLARQEGVREVRSVFVEDKSQYLRFVDRACCYSRAYGEWGPWLAEQAGIPAAPIWPCQPQNGKGAKVYRPRPLTLDPAAAEWARQFEPGWLLFPQSDASCPLSQHWPHWREAITWILNVLPGPIYLCGTLAANGLVPDHTKLINLIGQTPSMEHVFALANHCRRIIGTSNSIAMWGANQRIPGVYGCNLQLSQSPYFQEWVQTKANRLVSHGEGLEKFKRMIVSQGWCALSVDQAEARSS